MASKNPVLFPAAILHGVFVLSGLSALIYQLVWQRALLMIYGSNIESVAMVVASFLAGLGIGSLLGLALALGLLIGVQRGWASRTDAPGSRFAGIRTHALFGLAGGIAGGFIGPWAGRLTRDLWAVEFAAVEAEIDAFEVAACTEHTDAVAQFGIAHAPFGLQSAAGLRQRKDIIAIDHVDKHA